jgi:hypothetical protein
MVAPGSGAMTVVVVSVNSGEDNTAVAKATAGALAAMTTTTTTETTKATTAVAASKEVYKPLRDDFLFIR